MTDIVTRSANLRGEGEELRSEIDRHAKAMWDRLDREEQRLVMELRQVQALKDKFGWVAPVQSAGNQAIGKGLEAQRRAIGVVSSDNQGGAGGKS